MKGLYYFASADSNSGSVTDFAQHLLNKLHWGNQPEPVSWLPNTPFWTVLAYGISALVLLYMAKKIHHYRRQSYIRQAQKRCQTLLATKSYQHLPLLIKQLCQQRWPEEKLAHVSMAELPPRLLALQGGQALSQHTCEQLESIAYQQNHSLSQRQVRELQAWFKEFQ
ncbi:hypothetical protein SIN8267_01210 [Sinobacterium norvegicum]|uniref:DUF4381 domain-containing protein n=1 Tax=Sinobacterium norvegicum TaxID=1641715 RepID=A0ABM9AD36_9GAMM|nr:DUF4381 domain-containing protein [Sinobacterium norvegicum]CAH0991109.1 hypothetical protein SIN8267_01210 [Sinobacterium norvegicum]